LLIGYAREIGQQSATATVYHEVGHLFGLDHAREVSPSIMAPSAPLGQGFSPGDLQSLEMLYQPEVEPGMTVTEAIDALR
jgi:predicted Zn-dependent protease